MLCIEHLFIQDIRASWSSRDSPPLVLSDLLLLGAGRSHCVPAQLAEHLRTGIKTGIKTASRDRETERELSYEVTDSLVL